MGETLITARAGANRGYPDGGYELLSAGFASYAEAISSSSFGSNSKARIAELENQWHACGLTGMQSIGILSQLKSKIAWEVMPHEQFSLFYRFIFYISKDPKKKHLRTDVAIMAWRLILHGRFRLLERWCEFVRSKGASLQVVSEDQWCQVWDFTRTVHEDLSNFDMNGAWSWILDEFVEHLRAPSWSVQGMECDMSPSTTTTASGHALPIPINKIGGKRRSPDVDTVAEQLSHLSSSAESIPLMSQQRSIGTPKRHCGEGGVPWGIPVSVQHQNHLPAGLTSASSDVMLHQQPMDLAQPSPAFDPLILDLPAVQTMSGARRVRFARRSGVSDLLSSTISDALGLG